MNYKELTDALEQELRAYFKQNINPDCAYHNQEHTEQVVHHATALADFYQLSEGDRFVVVVAAWFHDMGYYNGAAKDHEARGAEAAGVFLAKSGVSQELITKTQGCILATRLPQSPRNLLEEIVCDADLYHFGTNDFSERNKLMRQEAIWRKGEKISKADWRKSTIKLLESHTYHTAYAKEKLNPGKASTLARLKAKDREESGEPQSLPESVTTENTSKKIKPDRPDKGIETMFRITSNNHQRLSDMADNKANIMITTTSIILSVLLTVLIRRLEENPYLTIPTVMLATICVITMVFSILSTRPSLPRGTFTPEDIREKRVNLLFFGNFYRMNFQEYSEGMYEMMNDRDFLYGSLTRDVYAQGVVLGRKYRLLRVAYNVFMFGIVTSVIAFLFASYYAGPTA